MGLRGVTGEWNVCGAEVGRELRSRRRRMAMAGETALEAGR